MEFLDIILTKDSSLLLHAIHNPLYWRILKKTILLSGLQTLTKRSAKKKNSSLFMNSILWNVKMRVENQTKTPVWEASSLCPETSTKYVVQEFHPSSNPPLKVSPLWKNMGNLEGSFYFLLLQLLRKFASLPASPSFPCSGCTISPSIVWPTDIQKSGIHSQALYIF